MTDPEEHAPATPPTRQKKDCPLCGEEMVNALVEYVCPSCGHTVVRPKAAATMRRRRRRAIIAGSVVALAGLGLVIGAVYMAYLQQAPEGGVVSGSATVRSGATSGQPRTVVPVECLGDSRLRIAPFYGVGLLPAPPYHTVLIVGRRMGSMGPLELPVPEEPFVQVWHRPEGSGAWNRTHLERADCRGFEVEVVQEHRSHDAESYTYSGSIDIDCDTDGLSIQADVEFSDCRRDSSLGVRSLE